MCTVIVSLNIPHLQRRKRSRSRTRSRSRKRSASPRRRSRRSRSRSKSPRSRTRSRSRDRRPADPFPRSLGGPMNAPHEEAVEFAKQSKRENRVYVGNLSYDVKYRDLMEFMRGGGLGNLRLAFRIRVQRRGGRRYFERDPGAETFFWSRSCCGVSGLLIDGWRE